MWLGGLGRVPIKPRLSGGRGFKPRRQASICRVLVNTIDDSFTQETQTLTLARGPDGPATMRECHDLT